MQIQHPWVSKDLCTQYKLQVSLQWGNFLHVHFQSKISVQGPALQNNDSCGSSKPWKLRQEKTNIKPRKNYLFKSREIFTCDNVGFSNEQVLLTTEPTMNLTWAGLADPKSFRLHRKFHTLAN